MTSEAVRELALELSRQEMNGNRLKKQSQAAALKAQQDFLDWTERKGYALERMGRDALREYHATLCAGRSKKSGEPLSPHTVNDRFHAIRVLFSLLYREEVMSENPAENLRLELPEAGGIKRRPLTREELTRFLEHLDTGTAQGLKDRTLFELMYSSGLRVAEAACLKVKDIDFDRREMTVRGKGDRDRVVPFSKVAKEFLLLFLGVKADMPESWVFCGSRGSRVGEHLRSGSISERFRVLLRRFEMDKPEISTHSIRHSTATHLLENGASVRHVQELLGHKSIETTVRYTHMQNEAVARMYRKYHPQEHEYFKAVDGEYLKRLHAILEPEEKV
jgi:integrase/recombinase XerD